jgi:cyanophycinase
MKTLALVAIALAVSSIGAASAQAQSAAVPTPFVAEPYGTGPVKVGPPNGTVIAVGGGSLGPRIFDAFIKAAGGPDSLILYVPNNSIGKPTTTAPASSGDDFRKHGAHNVQVLFTQSREVADSDAFVAIIKQAKGIWFEGGRQYRVMEAYAGTKTERAFAEVLERGGVIAGSSAGMAVLGDFLVRGAPSEDNYILDYPGFEKGLGYLRNTAADMHVVARERLPDLTSLTARYPKVLGISADEGTAWVVQGDVGRIIGSGKAFVYNRGGLTDPGVPYLMLYPGDTFNLFTRQVVNRAAERSPVTEQFVTSLFKKYDAPESGGATVLVAENGEVLVDRAFGIPRQERYMPRTTSPQFPIGDIRGVFEAVCSQVKAEAPSGEGERRKVFHASALDACAARLSGPVGLHKTTVPPGSHEIVSDVDELYRFELGLEDTATWPKADRAKGWQVDTFKGVRRLATYATRGAERSAFVRIPERHATVIILTNDARANARAMSESILEKLLK